MKNREKFVALFREIQPKFSQIYARLLGKIDLTLPQFALLSQLVILGSVSMTTVSRKLRITKPAVTNLVDRLEEKKFLKRVPHSRDRRVILLHILPKGEKTVATIRAHGLEFILKAYDQFTNAEHEVISRFYSLLLTAIDETLARGKNEK